MKSIVLLILLSIYFINCKLPFFNLIKTKKGISEEKKITYVYGHINPDTDAISSAIILCDYLQQKYPQKIFIPGRLWEINKETEYALNYFKFNVPKLITDPVEADEVILVDHNNPTQSIKFDKANIIGLIDHHAITGFYTNNPIKILNQQEREQYNKELALKNQRHAQAFNKMMNSNSCKRVLGGIKRNKINENQFNKITNNDFNITQKSEILNKNEFNKIPYYGKRHFRFASSGNGNVYLD